LKKSNCNIFLFHIFSSIFNKILQNNKLFFLLKGFWKWYFYEKKKWTNAAKTFNIEKKNLKQKMLPMNLNLNRKMCIMMMSDLNGMYDVLRRFISQNDSILFHHDKLAEWSQFLMYSCLTFLLNHSNKNFHLQSWDRKWIYIFFFRYFWLIAQI
jgi:hypothetical protein